MDMCKPDKELELGPLKQAYVDLVEDISFDEAVDLNTERVLNSFSSLAPEKWNYAYEQDKWTVKQLFHHIIDTERVMAFRALNALRGQSIDGIPGMDENLFANHAEIDHKTPEMLLEEFEAVRAATKYLFLGLNDESGKRTARVLGKPTSARALAFMLLGHAVHHVNVLLEKYLSA